jgi:hypothetical protein
MMKTKEILKDIADMGGFDNFRHWNRSEIAVWVRTYFHCSRYIAKNVALYL